MHNIVGTIIRSLAIPTFLEKYSSIARIHVFWKNKESFIYLQIMIGSL